MQDWMLMAMAAPPSGNGGGAAAADPMAGLMSMLPLVLIFVLFYLLFIVPQRKQQKKHAELLKTLKKGDAVVTSGGVFGVVSGFNEKDNTVFIKVAEKVSIEVQRGSIAGLRGAASAETTPAQPPR